MPVDLRAFGLLVAASGAVRALPANEASSIAKSLPIEPPSVAKADDGRAAVSTGFNHACGLDAGGRAFCWASNASGQHAAEAIQYRTLDRPPG